MSEVTCPHCGCEVVTHACTRLLRPDAPPSATVERVAEAAHAACRNRMMPVFPWTNEPEFIRAQWRDIARAAIAALPRAPEVQRLAEAWVEAEADYRANNDDNEELRLCNASITAEAAFRQALDAED